MNPTPKYFTGLDMTIEFNSQLANDGVDEIELDTQASIEHYQEIAIAEVMEAIASTPNPVLQMSRSRRSVALMSRKQPNKNACPKCRADTGRGRAGRFCVSCREAGCDA